MTETLHARTSAEVADVAARGVAADAVAFDTEFLWERIYRPVLCLVQVGIDGLEATVDPLARDDLGPLWEALVGGPTVVVHAGLHDFDILYRQAGRLPARVFDTQVAAGFLGHGDTTGYGNLTGAVLRRVVRGGEGYTDWSRRPLSGDQLDYALEDVRHLLPLWRMLSGELETRGRTAWAGEEVARRFEGIGEPGGPQEAGRREAAAGREEEAMRRDEPRQRLVPDRVLVEVARRAPTDSGQIAVLRGLHPGQAELAAGPPAGPGRRAGRGPPAAW